MKTSGSVCPNHMEIDSVVFVESLTYVIGLYYDLKHYCLIDKFFHFSLTNTGVVIDID
jgi:hypothetical protein